MKQQKNKQVVDDFKQEIKKKQKSTFPKGNGRKFKKIFLLVYIIIILLMTVLLCGVICGYLLFILESLFL